MVDAEFRDDRIHVLFDAEHDCLRDVLGIEPVESEIPRLGFAGHGRFDHPRRDDGDANLRLLQVLGDRFGEADDAPLRCAVGRGILLALLP